LILGAGVRAGLGKQGPCTAIQDEVVYTSAISQSPSSTPDVPFPAPLRCQLSSKADFVQAKPATLLILIGVFLSSLGEGVLQYTIPKWPLSP